MVKSRSKSIKEADTTKFSIKINNVERKDEKDSHLEKKDEKDSHEYDPPIGPPPAKQPLRKPLQPVELPLVLPAHRFNLAAQGWTTITLTPTDPEAAQIHHSLQTLFAASKTFFARPAAYKAQFRTALDSEEGWQPIPGEKEFITLRTDAGAHMPPDLAGPVAEAWRCIGALLLATLERIAASLALAPDALGRFAAPCAVLGARRTATMLRVFRYEGWHAHRVVAEPHCDLGLLSFVAGDSPGLEVWSGGPQGGFYPIEKRYADLTREMTVLVGRQLQQLSNGVYNPGPHRVQAYPQRKSLVKNPFRPSGKAEKRYRYSIVFVLRAFTDLVMDAKSLQSDVTGVNKVIKDGMSASQWFDSIRLAHYNINTGIEKRNRQKRVLEELQKEGTSKQSEETLHDNRDKST